MAASFSGPFMRPWTSPTRSPNSGLERGVALLRGGQVGDLRFLDQRADPVDLGRRRRRPARRRGHHLVEPLERHRPGVDRLAARPASRSGARRPCRRRRSAAGCAGSASRSSPARRRRGPCRPAAGAGGRRSGAARRSRPARGRGRRRPPGTGHGCRRRCRPRPSARLRAISARAPCPCRGRSAGTTSTPAASASGSMRRGVLARQDLGRRHQGGLAAGLDRGQHGHQRDHRLAAADVALQQAQHALIARHVGQDLARSPCSATPVSAKGRACSATGAQAAVAGQRRGRARASARRAPGPAPAGWPAARR